MSERLAEVEARIRGIEQLGTVVNAMRGIAAARAQSARAELAAVDAYAAAIADAITTVLRMQPGDGAAAARTGVRIQILFCAEQGFAGAYGERVLARADAGAELFLVGTRGMALAAERGLHPAWSSALPAHTQGIPMLADRIVEALFARLAAGEVAGVDVVRGEVQAGQPIDVRSDRLFPLDPAAFRDGGRRAAPLLNLPPAALLPDFTAAYLHARLCEAALHAFGAENEARMQTMASAHRQVERELGALRANARQVRQDEITAEIIELATGEIAAREQQG